MATPALDAAGRPIKNLLSRPSRNPKAKKGRKRGYANYMLHLAPSDRGEAGRQWVRPGRRPGVAAGRNSGGGMMRAYREPTIASYRAADRLIAEVVSEDRQRADRRDERRMDAVVGVVALVVLILWYGVVL